MDRKNKQAQGNKNNLIFANHDKSIKRTHENDNLQILIYDYNGSNFVLEVLKLSLNGSLIESLNEKPFQTKINASTQNESEYQ